MAKKTEDKKSTVKSTVTIVELREKSVKELREMLAQVKKDLSEASRMLVAGELVNPRVIAATRKTVARINTLINEKSTEESNAKGKED